MPKNIMKTIANLTKKINNGERKLYIEPVFKLNKQMKAIANMSYSEFAGKNKENNDAFLKAAYSRLINCGTTPTEAKRLSMEALKKKLDKEKAEEISKLEAEITKTGKEYSNKLFADADKLNKLLNKWNIPKAIKGAVDEKEALEMAQTYINAHNCINREKVSLDDIMFYFPVIKKETDGTVILVLKDVNCMTNYSTELCNSLKITEKGFILNCTEYTEITAEIAPVSPKMDKYEKKEAELVNNVSPKDFQKGMFNSPLAEHEIIDRCMVSYCNYMKGNESIVGIQVKYEGEDAYEKFYDICSGMLVSDVFHGILGKTSMFLTGNIINFKDVFKERIEKARKE